MSRASFLQPNLGFVRRRFGAWGPSVAAGFLVCTVFGVLFSASFRAVVTGGLPWSKVFSMFLVDWYIVGMLVPLVVALDRRVPAGASLARRFGWHLPLSLVWFGAFLGVRGAVDAVAWRHVPPQLGEFGFKVAHYALWIYWTYWVVLALYLARRLGQEGERRAREAAEAREALVRAERSASEARLHALEGQLNPHFLFNALNAISAYVERDPKMARRLMADLADVLRFTLDHTRGEAVPLDDELAILDRYLDLERARYGDDLDVRIEVDPAARQALVPALVLQPLVENAIRHGLRTRAGAGALDVTAALAGERLVLRVRDDGVGLPSGWQIEDQRGVGLSNTRERLALMYGPDHALRVGNAPGGGVLVEVEVPFRPATARLARAEAYA